MKKPRQPPTLKNQYYSYLVGYSLSCIVCAVLLFGTVLMLYDKEYTAAAVGATLFIAQLIVNIMGYSRVWYLGEALKAQKRSELHKPDQRP